MLQVGRVFKRVKRGLLSILPRVYSYNHINYRGYTSSFSGSVFFIIEPLSSCGEASWLFQHQAREIPKEAVLESMHDSVLNLSLLVLLLT